MSGYSNFPHFRVEQTSSQQCSLRYKDEDYVFLDISGEEGVWYEYFLNEMRVNRGVEKLFIVGAIEGGDRVPIVSRIKKLRELSEKFSSTVVVCLADFA